jgi:hypothetical protein
MNDLQKKFLPPLLVVTGIAFAGIKLMMILFPLEFGWEPPQPEYEGMIVVVYFVLGVFMLIASRDPMSHLSLIWFTAISSVLHGLFMLYMALIDPAEVHNLWGDIPALIGLGVLLMIFTPRKLTNSG